jgi:NTE family protein
MKHYNILIAFLLFFLGLDVCAQDQNPTSSRKRVAVVLSGGGAKGMAHIGALKVFEKAGIPIDIITGTSMGSIVGGLYAIGYDAATLDSLVRSQNWAFLLSDMKDGSKLSLEDRRRANTYIIQKEFSANPNVSEAGLITGRNLAVLFDELVGEYGDSINFSSLPIPYACVATNIIDNTEYIFHRGRLAQAMRASMAIPGAFSPVKLYDKVLVDGGLRNNYPVDVAREMGADIIIGVTVQEIDRKTAEDLGSTGSLLMQLIDVNCLNKYDDNLAITDVAIRVNTKGYNTASFTAEAIDSLINRGEQTALAHWDELMALKKEIGISDDFRPTILQPYKQNAVEQMKIQSLEFLNMTANDERFLRSKFHLREGDTISVDRAEMIKTSMRVDLFYKDANCRFLHTDDGTKVIFIAGRKKNSQINVGARYDTEEVVAMQLNADLPIRASVPADIDFTVRLGRRMMGSADISLHPRSFAHPSFSYIFRYNDINMYEKGDKGFNITYNQHTANLSLLNFYVRNFEVNFSAQWDYYHYRDMLIDHKNEDQEIELEDDHYISYRASVNYISEDNWNFPTKGSRFMANFALHTDNFTKMKGEEPLMDISAMWRKSWTSGRFTFQPTFYGRLLFGDVIPPMLNNMVGGLWFGHYLEHQMPFAGVGHIEQVYQHFVGVQLQGQLRMGKNHFVTLRATTAQHAPKFSQLMDHRTLIGGSLSYYYNTIIGPVGTTLGYSNKSKEVNMFFNIGYEF